MLNIGFDIGTRLVHILQDGHFLFDDLDALLATRVMFEDQLLLLFQDLLNNFLVVLSQLLDVLGVFGLQLIN